MEDGDILADIESLKHLLYLIDAVALVEGSNEKLDPTDTLEDASIAEDIAHYHQREQEMREVLTRTRSFWKDLVNQVQAIYDPQLVPIRESGIIIGWIDERTGMQPWFS